MKIAIDCRMLNSGGVGTYLESLLPFFVNKFDCLLFGKIELLQKLNLQKVELYNCNISCFSIKELLTFDKPLLQKINSCDVYYSPYFNIPSKIKIPVLSTIHDIVFLDINLTSKIGTLARKFFYQRAINKSCTIFTVSNFSKERIQKKLHTKKTPIVVTYNSVPQWFLDYAKQSKNNKKANLLYVGNIKKHKGLHTLLDAFCKIQKQGFTEKLIIVGNKDNFRTTDNSFIKNIENIKQIEFTGRIDDLELAKLYASSKLLIQPSLYEGFGMPPLEALYCGTNVLISDIEIFKEIYEKFPVTYFSVEDSDDLAKKIMDCYNNSSPSNLPDIYSFKNTFSIIENSCILHKH